MLEHRTATTGDDGRKPLSLRCEPIVANGVDTARNEPSGPHPLGNPMSTKAEHPELAPAHNAPLPPRNPLQPG
jgi:hypothetical protein